MCFHDGVLVWMNGSGNNNTIELRAPGGGVGARFRAADVALPKAIRWLEARDLDPVHEFPPRLAEVFIGPRVDGAHHRHRGKFSGLHAPHGFHGRRYRHSHFEVKHARLQIEVVRKHRARRSDPLCLDRLDHLHHRRVHHVPDLLTRNGEVNDRRGLGVSSDEGKLVEHDRPPLESWNDWLTPWAWLRRSSFAWIPRGSSSWRDLR